MVSFQTLICICFPTTSHAKELQKRATFDDRFQYAVPGLAIEVSGSGFGFEVSGLRFKVRVSGFGFRVQGLGFRVLGFRVQGL